MKLLGSDFTALSYSVSLILNKIVWLDESEKQIKKTFKTIILETVPDKCDI
jgi:hypothetical protein